MDLIDRQAAINALNDEITITGKTNAVIVQDYIRRVNNRLHDLPSVQTCEDAVSRQEAIDAIKNADVCMAWHGEISAEDAAGIAVRVTKCSVVDSVKALPAVQPEPKPDENGSEPFGNAEKMHDRTMDDCISRQAAIDIERNATVDTNPSHFEAHQKFTQFMDDAEISSFGRWQWSNGFNTALTAVGIDLKKLPAAQPERTCVNCGRTVNNGGWYADGGTRCPIEEHYALPKDGYCHLWEKRNVTDDDYPERREE